jgi:hypothetical protein
MLKSEINNFHRLDLTPYRSGPSRTWIKVKNPKAPAATRAIDGTFYEVFHRFFVPESGRARTKIL